MLVVSRANDERIVLSNGTRITLVRSGHAKARIGIEAPPEVRVWREELLAAEDLARIMGPPEAPVQG